MSLQYVIRWIHLLLLFLFLLLLLRLLPVCLPASHLTCVLFTLYSITLGREFILA